MIATGRERDVAPDETLQMLQPYSVSHVCLVSRSAQDSHDLALPVQDGCAAGGAENYPIHGNRVRRPVQVDYALNLIDDCKKSCGIGDHAKIFAPVRREGRCDLEGVAHLFLGCEDGQVMGEREGGKGMIDAENPVTALLRDEHVVYPPVDEILQHVGAGDEVPVAHGKGRAGATPTGDLPDGKMGVVPVDRRDSQGR